MNAAEMSNFSDQEDRHLVLLASAYEDRGEKVSWASLAHAMRYSKKDARALKRRLSTLKTTHGKVIRGFPSRFFKTLQPAQDIQPRCRNVVYILPHPETSPACLMPSPLPVSLVEIVKLSKGGDPSIKPSDPCVAVVAPQAKLLKPVESHRAVARIFSEIDWSDVRQAAGRTWCNVGEISTQGVSSLIHRCRPQSQDIFLDVGSGIGNVIAQVVLETSVNQAFGIEIRVDVASRGAKAMADAALLYPRLSQAVTLRANVLEFADDWSMVAGATILYTNNFVFTPESNQAVHHLCCRLPKLRVVVVSARVCPRHQRRCTREFCLIWCEDGEALALQTEFRSSPLPMYSYRRRHE